MDRVKKSMIMSCVFMGLGQIYNKYFLKGIFLFIVELLAIFNIPTFINGFWNIVTLGEKAQQVDGFDIIQGDHSIFLLVNGMMTTMLLILFVILYAVNINDAARCAKQFTAGKKIPGTFEYIKHIWANNFFGVTVTPGALGLIFFTLLPIIITIAVAFTNYSGPDHLPPKSLVDWVGLENFKNLVNLKIWQSTFVSVGIWTVIWAVSTTFLNYAVGLMMALITAKKGIRFKRLWRTIFILPYAIPAFISLLVFRLILNGAGPVNNILNMLGIGRIPFFADPLMAKISVIMVNTWLGAPYFMVLLAGALTNISSDLYEAAEIDGANKIQQFFKITMPMLLFQTAPVLILSFAYNFNNFGAIYFLTDGNPTNSTLKYAGETDIFLTWVYKLTMDQRQFHMASVISIILFIFIAIFSAYTFSRTKSFKEEDMI